MDVSIVIATHRPFTEIEGTIRSCIIQEGCDYEVILVLNNPAVKPPEHEKLVVKNLNGNFGAVARNEGIAIAKGKYIVCIDDDIEFKDSLQLINLKKYMDCSPEVYAADFKVLSPRGGLDDYSWCHPRDRYKYADTDFETYYISEGAVVFRRETFDIIGGGYFLPLFIGHEGGDLALRMVNKGLKIVYFPGVEVIHKKSDVGRPHGRTYYYLTRNGIWVAWKNLPWNYAVYYTIRTMALMLFFSSRSSGISAYLSGIRDGFKELPMIFKLRDPISKEAMIKLKDINRHKPSLFSRFRFHLREKIQ